MAERLSVNLPTALRRDPSHAAELLVLYALGYLAPRLERRRHSGRRVTVKRIGLALAWLWVGGAYARLWLALNPKPPQSSEL